MRIYTTRTLAVITLAILSIGSPKISLGQDAVSRTYQIVDTQSNSMDIPGQGEQKIDITTTSNVTVTQTGERQFHVKVDSISVEGSPAGAGGLDKLNGLESDVTLAVDGSVESMSGLEGNAGIAAMGGEAAFRDRLQAMFLHGPGEEMTVGKTWSHSDMLPTSQQGMEVERVVNASYTCVGEAERDGVPVWIVEVKTKIDMTGSGSASGQTMDMEMSGEGTGKQFVDKASGLLVSSENEGTMEGTIDLEAFSILMTVAVHNSVSSASK